MDHPTSFYSSGLGVYTECNLNLVMGFVMGQGLQETALSSRHVNLMTKSVPLVV